MHKRIVNQAIIEITISPVGPLLIKASDQGADPTKPDMEFVETYHTGGRSVYLPGSSLKGAIRSHCERIVRTIGGDGPVEKGVWTCDPLQEDAHCRNLRDCHPDDPAAVYKNSCVVCKIFGSTDMASHIRITDAYPDKSTEVQLEERNGVAIDRIKGSVAQGPFNFQVVTAGEFNTRIVLKNFTIAQLALLALVIRDFDEQRVGIGLAKSRGLGQVNMKVKRIEIRYPTAVVEDDHLRMIGKGNQSNQSIEKNVVGVGELISDAESYGFPSPDSVNISEQVQSDDLGIGATVNIDSSESSESSESTDGITELWRACVDVWRQRIEEE